MTYPEWITLAAPIIIKDQENEIDPESLFINATEHDLLMIEKLIPKDNVTMFQYQHMLQRLHKAGLNRY